MLTSKLTTILLTGANGFLGSHLLESLIKHNYEVIILKRSISDTWRISHLLRSVKSYNIDKNGIKNIFEENSIDYIVHMSTLYQKYDNGLEISEMINANISLPVELIEIGIRNGLQGFINTGTFIEYDCSILPIGEGAVIRPTNLYAKTKTAFELILSTYSPKICIKTLRLFSPYGEKDNYKLVPMVIQRALSHERVELSEGLQKLDFIYVGDVVEAYLKALVSMLVEPNNTYRIYNIGSGMGISVREIVSIVEKQLNTPIDKHWGAPSSVDAPEAYADVTRAMNELNWHPRVSVYDGIAKTIRYYRETKL